MSKIINLSFQRNATQSISQIFFNMNIPGIHHIATVNNASNFRGHSLEDIQESILSYENHMIHFADAPYFLMYEYFDNKYKDAKFILIKRDPQKWLQSFRKLYTIEPIDPVSRACFEKYLPKFKFIDDHELHLISDKELLTMYNYHNLKIEKYFKNKNNLLTLHIDDSEKIEKMCRFLGIDIIVPEENIDYLRKMSSN